MIDLDLPYRPATPDDAHALAELVNMAGEGLPYYVWSEMAAPGESVWDVGRNRAMRDSGGFSYRNAVVRVQDSKVISCLIGYPLDDEPGPVNYDDIPLMFVPLQQLEDEVPGTWYVNVLATYPAYRGNGYGQELLTIAELIARDLNKSGMSVIVSDANPEARRLYEKTGYRERGSRPMVKNEWKTEGNNWILLSRNI